jgi:hypothetical protein
MDKLYVVGIAGKKYSGKGVIASLLKEKLQGAGINVVVIPYAFRLKKILIDFVSDVTDMSKEDVSRYFYDSIYKEQYIPKLWQTTSRTLMVKFGTDFARDNVSENIWLHCLNQEIARVRVNTPGPLVVIVDDVRFTNEVDNILQHTYFKMFYVKRDLKQSFIKRILERIKQHKSEDGVYHRFNIYDMNQFFIKNNSTIEALSEKLNPIFDEFIGEINESTSVYYR